MDPDRPPKMFPDEPEGPFGGPNPMRLLTRYEYDNTVRELLGVSRASYSEDFPSENLVHGFENNAYAHRVSPLLLRNYMQAAESLAGEALASRRAVLLSGCDVATAGAKACGETMIRTLVPRAFRRPALDEELALYDDLLNVALKQYDDERALGMVIEAVLQSPQFLYRIELPAQGDVAGTLRKVDSYALASRLSYFLWGSMPDAELFRAAADGELESLAQIEAQVRRMLGDERSTVMVDNFHRQWLRLDKIDKLTKDQGEFNEWLPKMATDWRASIDAFILDTFLEQGTLEAMLTSPTYHLTHDLAWLYGRVEQPFEGLRAFTFPGAERAGLLTHPALMGAKADPFQSSPILRGIFVRERLLCQLIPAPPNNVEITPPELDPTATTRERFAQHTSDASCASCHKLIDPIGFGFENYDSLGRFRTKEYDLEIDASGVLADVSKEPEIQGPFTGATELAGMLARSKTVHQCMAEQWYQYAFGRAVTELDEWPLKRVQKQFLDAEGRFRDLIVAITLSDTFRYVQLPGDQDGGQP